MPIDTMLALDIRPESEMPLYKQVYTQIRTAILTGRVRSHQKLPSSRQLAQSLSISRTTVTESYDQLVSEGYLETRRGAGTFVSAQIPDDLLITRRIEAQQTAVSPSKTLSPVAQELAASKITLSAFGRRLSEGVTLPASTPNRLSFRYWQPDLSLFPVKHWQRLVNRYASASSDWMTYATEPMGYGPLREAIADYIAQTRAVQCTPEQILITQGTQQALGLIAQILLEEGEAIAIEDPGYLSARKIVSSYGGLPIPIPVDEEGLVVDYLGGLGGESSHEPSAKSSAKSSARSVRSVKLAYVTPSHQFPTGVLMSLPRRLRLLEWARKTGSLIVEDDYDSEFRYAGRPVPALQGLGTAERVLYVGTFSKILFPGLRLGYIVLPPNLVPVFRLAKWTCDRQGTLLHQAALADFIVSGNLARHIRKMRIVYGRRRQHLVNALQSLTQPIGVTEIVGDPAGLHFMARLPLQTISLSASELVEQAQTRGVDLFSTAPYYASVPDTASSAAGEFIFGFGGLSEKAIDNAIDRLRPLFLS